MAFPINLILTLLFFFFSTSHFLFAAYTPSDNYLLNCGANTNVSLFSIRSFLGDSSGQGSTFLSADRSVPLSDPNPSPDSPVLYHTARVFPGGSSPSSAYKLRVTSKHTYFIRLHFAPFKAPGFNLVSAKFHVLVNGFSVMNSFGTDSVVVKEFIENKPKTPNEPEGSDLKAKSKTSNEPEGSDLKGKAKTPNEPEGSSSLQMSLNEKQRAVRTEEGSRKLAPLPAHSTEGRVKVFNRFKILSEDRSHDFDKCLS